MQNLQVMGGARRKLNRLDIKVQAREGNTRLDMDENEKQHNFLHVIHYFSYLSALLITGLYTVKILEIVTQLSYYKS